MKNEKPNLIEHIKECFPIQQVDKLCLFRYTTPTKRKIIEDTLLEKYELYGNGLVGGLAIEKVNKTKFRVLICDAGSFVYESSIFKIFDWVSDEFENELMNMVKIAYDLFIKSTKSFRKFTNNYAAEYENKIKLYKELKQVYKDNGLDHYIALLPCTSNFNYGTLYDVIEQYGKNVKHKSEDFLTMYKSLYDISFKRYDGQGTIIDFYYKNEFIWRYE